MKVTQSVRISAKSDRSRAPGAGGCRTPPAPAPFLSRSAEIESRLELGAIERWRRDEQLVFLAAGEGVLGRDALPHGQPVRIDRQARAAGRFDVRRVAG